MPFEDLYALRTLVLGAGEMASGAIRALHRAGLRRVLAVELPAPLSIRRAVAFAQAAFDGRCAVEGIPALRIEALAVAEALWAEGAIPVLVDAGVGRGIRAAFRPDILVDGRMAKRSLGIDRNEAPLVIGVGPGFHAGKDVHLVVETSRGHDLGRVIHEGPTLAHTGRPGAVGGETDRRLVRAPATGPWRTRAAIGDSVAAGDPVGSVGDTEARALIAGVLRGLLHDGVEVWAGKKVADVDPRGDREACYTVSDKARLVGAGVLEAILAWQASRAGGTQVSSCATRDAEDEEEIEPCRR